MSKQTSDGQTVKHYQHFRCLGASFAADCHLFSRWIICFSSGVGKSSRTLDVTKQDLRDRDSLADSQCQTKRRGFHNANLLHVYYEAFAQLLV